MVHGIDNIKIKKKKYKTTIERDIALHKDLREAYFQRGKAIGEITRKVFTKKKDKKK